MLEVHHLSFEFILHHIHQSQLISQILPEGRRERDGGMDGWDGERGEVGLEVEVRDRDTKENKNKQVKT